MSRERPWPDVIPPHPDRDDYPDEETYSKAVDAWRAIVPLVQCPRCQASAREPVHLLGPTEAWPGGRTPFPPMRWCTPAGIVTRDYHDGPPEGAPCGE